MKKITIHYLIIRLSKSTINDTDLFLRLYGKTLVLLKNIHYNSKVRE